MYNSTSVAISSHTPLLWMRYVAICIMLMATPELVAQFPLTIPNPLPQRNPSQAQIEHLSSIDRWYKPQWQPYFPYKFCPLTHVPPLHSGMPLNVMIGYWVLDSIYRTTNQRTVLDLREQLRSLNDTTKTIAKFWYELVDYDPILWNQYSLFGRHDLYSLIPDSIEVPIKKPARLPFLVHLFLDYKERGGIGFYDLLPEKNKIANRILLLSNYILRVKILDTDSMTARLSSDMQTFIYTCEVLDTIKGKKLPVSCESNAIVATHTSSHPIIKVSMFHDVYLNWIGGYTLDSKVDPAFFEPSVGAFRFKEGQEAVIFLWNINSLVDENYDYIEWQLMRGASNAPLLIVDGNVRDINRIWSDNELLPYQQWKERVNEHIQNILNKTY